MNFHSTTTVPSGPTPFAGAGQAAVYFRRPPRTAARARPLWHLLCGPSGHALAPANTRSVFFRHLVATSTPQVAGSPRIGRP